MINKNIEYKWLLKIIRPVHTVLVIGILLVQQIGKFTKCNRN